MIKKKKKKEDVCLPILVTHVQPDRGTLDPESYFPQARLQRERGSRCTCRSWKKAEGERNKIEE